MMFTINLFSNAAVGVFTNGFLVFKTQMAVGQETNSGGS
jgi:hypothetical protein